MKGTDEFTVLLLPSGLLLDIPLVERQDCLYSYLKNESSGSGCGSVGRAVAFKTILQQILVKNDSLGFELTTSLIDPFNRTTLFTSNNISGNFSAARRIQAQIIEVGGEEADHQTTKYGPAAYT